MWGSKEFYFLPIDLDGWKIRAFLGFYIDCFGYENGWSYFIVWDFLYLNGHFRIFLYGGNNRRDA